MGAIEIKELHIKINVDNEKKSSAETADSKKSGANKDMIIAECVEQVMRIIAKQIER
ncbi:hypothetical protein ATE84_1130 [Aquimarina sp. MAR_2010_214]|uniref:DUF5908 family protein n=1 Tax=Aquimarina sp. MAR_2010_214 TaxID=1250026 RepID=UPI000CB58250|nr:DUF5908 family protein [Aquimarina sp. MAR_2010_214]PKV49113.1 hypothetical protein ATE84_1130 [Aquimarina sp. MAR_2010_214]